MLTRPGRPSRNHVERKDIKRWSKHLDATPDQLQEVIEKVGNRGKGIEEPHREELRGVRRFGFSLA
jgi:hypothetical protein